MNKVMDFVKETVIPYIMLTLGAVFAAIALEEFLVPATILDGGINGVSIILNQLTGQSLSIFVLVLNIPFLLIGFRTMGKKFFIRSVYCMVLFSVMLEVFHHMGNVTEDELLAVVFGGVLLGASVGTVLRYGGCLDGTETVALLLSRKTSFSVGQIIFLINVVIYSVAGFLFGWDRALYSLLTYFISFKVIDMVEEGMEQVKAVMIITNDADQISRKIYEKLGRTSTRIDAAGMISGQKDVLYCVITRLEMPELKAIVTHEDVSAFVTITDVAQVIGTHVKKHGQGEKVSEEGM